MRSNTSTLILAGVAVASLLTSAQTFLQQQSSAGSITRVYIWLLGSLASAGWGSVGLVLPYVVVCIVICVGAGRALDVMSVGEDESRSLGVPVRRVRFIVIAASSLGTAAIVSAVGLIGFVGIIVPHIVRLLVGTSYRRILPISVVFGAAFLVFADTIARTVHRAVGVAARRGDGVDRRARSSSSSSSLRRPVTVLSSVEVRGLSVRAGIKARSSRTSRSRSSRAPGARSSDRTAPGKTTLVETVAGLRRASRGHRCRSSASPSPR